MKHGGDLFGISLQNGRKFDVAIRRISTGRDEYMHGQTEHTPFQHVHAQQHELEWHALMAAAQMMRNQNTHDAKRHF